MEKKSSTVKSGRAGKAESTSAPSAKTKSPRSGSVAMSREVWLGLVQESVRSYMEAGGNAELYQGEDDRIVIILPQVRVTADGRLESVVQEDAGPAH